MNETGGIPPGNANGNTTWSITRSAPKPELKLTPGKGLQDLTCSVEDLIDQVVKSNKVWHSSLDHHKCSGSTLRVLALDNHNVIRALRKKSNSLLHHNDRCLQYHDRALCNPAHVL